MADGKKVSRRAAVHTGFLASLGALGGKLFARGAEKGGACKTTPEQTSGPFYPTEDGEDEDLDLTLIEGRDERAQGAVIYVRGRVLDEECEPVPDALVEIWQANTHGRYHHERDTSPAPVDPNFQGWGEVVTNRNGEYGFKTVLPGPYGTGGGMRTRHIHFRVSRRGYHELITQMYFEGEELNPKDGIWTSLSPAERERVTVRRERMPEGDGDEGLCRFDIVMQRV